MTPQLLERPAAPGGCYGPAGAALLLPHNWRPAGVAIAPIAPVRSAPTGLAIAA